MARNDWQLLPAIIENFRKETELSTEQIIKGTIFALGGAIIADTPVDEGITRGNWYFTKAGPSRNYNPNAQNITDGESYARNEVEALGDILGQTIYLTNNAPNILVLENGGYLNSSGSPANGPKTVAGYSKQAPAGMVRVNLRRFGRIIENEAS